MPKALAILGAILDKSGVSSWLWELKFDLKMSEILVVFVGIYTALKRLVWDEFA